MSTDKPYSSILLFSGGVDSFVAYYYLNQPQTVFFKTNHRYQPMEIQSVKSLIPSTIIDNSINFSTREVGPKAYIPFRNLHYACLASKYADIIYIAGNRDDKISDKTPEIFEEFSDLLSRLDGRKISVMSPFWELSKPELVEWYLNYSIDDDYETRVQNLLGTASCYASDLRTKFCGECPACFRKWVAFWLNGIKLRFNNEKVLKEYWNLACEGKKYNTDRNTNMLNVISQYTGWKIPIDKLVANTGFKS